MAGRQVAEVRVEPAASGVPLAIVQHGHQYLITEGYDNHEGILEVLDGFGAVFALHLEHRVPFNLHLSGTLIEAVAWHAPEFFDWVRTLRDEGLVEMVGSGYSQSILTLFSWEHNLRQLNETLDLYQRHLGVDPTEVRGFWVPERVWSTPKLAGLLRSDRLLNGGYDWVLIDDRLTYPSTNGAHPMSDRRRFDVTSAPAGKALAPGDGPGPGYAEHLRPYRIEDGRGLVALPISGELRYCIPPRKEAHWDRLRQTIGVTARAGEDALAVYGDDLEKTATLGPWTSGSWRRENVTPYEHLLEELSGDHGLARPVLISEWLAANPPSSRRRVDPGTFFELAKPAGEDYLGWWNAGTWAFYRQQLVEAEALLNSAGGGSALWELAWKQLMACSYETAWHDTMGTGTQGPAPWARAVASHVRSVFVIAAAAEWAERDVRPLEIEVADVDRDGREEVVLRNEHVYAVVTPGYGGRLVYLVHLDGAGGFLVVGNPADDWNWQEDLNRFMEVPRNHPGAFADVGHENDRWEVVGARPCRGGATVEAVLGHVRGGCPLQGSLKTFRLDAGARHLEVSYRLATRTERFGVEFALSPDYLTLLRDGRAVARPVVEGRSRGFRAGPATVWVQLPAGEPVVWEHPPASECGHGLLLRATAWRGRFDLRLGVGLVPADEAIDLRDAAPVAMESAR